MTLTSDGKPQAVGVSIAPMSKDGIPRETAYFQALSDQQLIMEALAALLFRQPRTADDFFLANALHDRIKQLA